MKLHNTDPDVLPFCPHCKELERTGRPVAGRLPMVGDYAHFFYFGNVPYVMRFARCDTCRRPYVCFMTYCGYHAGPGLYYPFPRAYPIT